jgi:hypothetical protein
MDQVLSTADKAGELATGDCWSGISTGAQSYHSQEGDVKRWVDKDLDELDSPTRSMYNIDVFKIVDIKGGV